MLVKQLPGLIFLLAAGFLVLDWVHEFPLLSGTALARDHLGRADDWVSELDLGRRLRSSKLEVNGLYTTEDASDRALRIPKILHQIYLDGADRFERDAANTSSRLDAAWRTSCLDLHPDWEIRFWDLAKAEKFLAEKAPAFLPAFKALPKTVLKGDVLRPFLMFHFGGMYLDIDVECFKPADPMLMGWDMILQSEYQEMQDISNAMLASVPGLPYWQALMDASMAAADALAHRRRLDVQDVLHATGPPLYTQIFKEASKSRLCTLLVERVQWQHFACGKPGRTIMQHLDRIICCRPSTEVAYPNAVHQVVGGWKIGNAWIRVYGLDSFYVPCSWLDRACHEDLIQRHNSNGWIPEDLVGHHHYLGSWISDVEPDSSSSSSSSDMTRAQVISA